MLEKGHNVNVRIRSTIEDAGEKEINTSRQTGKLFRKNNIDVLLYEEVDEDGDKINNLMTIQPDRVNIKRSGFIAMNQLFEPGQKTETNYQHPHGSMYMKTHTHSIVYNALDSDIHGKLTINYTVTLNGMIERKHLLELTYKEEGS